MTGDLPTIDGLGDGPPADRNPVQAALAHAAARPGEPREPRVSYAVEFRYAPRGGAGARWRSVAGQDWDRLRECATRDEAMRCRRDVGRRAPDYAFRVVRRESFTVCEDEPERPS